MPKAYAATSVTQYLSMVPPFQGRALEAVRRSLLDEIPGVTESFEHRLILFRSHGRALLGLSAARFDCSLHLMSPELARALDRDGTPGARISGAALQFATGTPPGRETIRMLVGRRVAELGPDRAHSFGSTRAVA